MDGAVILWNVAKRKQITTLEEHRDAVSSVAFSQDGTLLASGLVNGRILLWNVSEWTLPRPDILRKISGDNQQGTTRAMLANPLIVEVRDQNDNPLPDVQITFRVTAGAGKLSGRFTIEYATTDANGRAERTLILGPNPGTNTVEVSIVGRNPEMFNAISIGTPTVPNLDGDYPTWHVPDGAIARLGKGPIGTGDKAVAFSPNGQSLAVASGIGVWLYDVATSRELMLLPSASAVSSVAFSRNGMKLASGSVDGTVALWNIATGQNTDTFEARRGKISPVSLSQKGTLTASRSVESVAFSPNGTLIASGRKDGTVVLLDIATGNATTLEGHTDWVSSVAFSRQGVLASGSLDRTIKLWNVQTGTRTDTFEARRGNVLSIAFSPDGTILASGLGDGTILLWDIATENATPLEKHTDDVRSVAFSPDGTILASGSDDNTIKLWNVQTRTNTTTFEGHTDHVNSVSLSQDEDERLLLSSGSLDGTVLLWDVNTRTTTTLEGHTQSVSSVAFSPDEGETLLASGSLDGTILLWDTARREQITSLEEHSADVFSVSFSPGGRLIASGSIDGTILLWDIVTENTATFEGHTQAISSVAFSPDESETLLASGSIDGTILLWDVATRTNTASFKVPAISSMAFSPDGTILSSGSVDGTILLWNVVTGNTTTLEGHTQVVSSMAFAQSEDGELLLASGSLDGTILLWNVATRTTTATLKGHTQAVSSVSFSPDGTILSSGSLDDTILLWDVATENATLLEGHRNNVFSVAFSPDGMLLSSGSEDGTILLWDMSPYITSQTPNPDFDGDGTVGIPDFLLFVEHFGLSQGDAGYDSRYDLDRNDTIGIGDLLIFVNALEGSLN